MPRHDNPLLHLIEYDKGVLAVRYRGFVQQSEVQDCRFVLCSHLQTLYDLHLEHNNDMHESLSCDSYIC
jgi:hypothetical protein